MNRTWFFGFVFLISVMNVGAYEPLDSLTGSERDKADSSLELILAARDEVWGDNTNHKKVERLLQRAVTQAKGVEDAAARDYLLARVELNRGRRILVGKGKKKELLSTLEAAIRLAEASVEERESSEGLRVLADSSSLWMVNKGLFAIIGTAGKVSKWSERALILDSRNSLAELVYIQVLIEAPKGSGGDTEGARRRLLGLHGRSDLDNVERFWTRTSLAMVHKKLKEKEEAARWCLSAGEIFADNVLVQKCREKLNIRD